MTDIEDIFSRVYRYISNRNIWTQKQKLWYEMRFDGVRRKGKPWKNAADLHVPIADKKISEFLPYYNDQIYSSQYIATFIPKEEDQTDTSEEIEKYFDYQVRQETNFEDAVVLVADKFLQSGVSLLKPYYCADSDSIKLDAIDAIDVIVPGYCKDLQDLDLFVHQIEIPVNNYKQKKNFNQKESFVDQISGSVTTYYNDPLGLKQFEGMRMGIQNYSVEEEVIIIWEIYEKCESTNEDGETEWKWYVSKWSPLNCEEPIQEGFELPYAHGELPFIDFYFERTDESFYSGRGIPELVAAEEAQANANENLKTDRMQLASKPVMMVDSTNPSQQNIDLTPGKSIPFKMEVLEFPTSPVDFNAERQLLEQSANQRVGSPDANLQDGQNGKIDNPTKFQVQSEVGLAMKKVGFRARLFRKSLAKTYKQIWSLMLQYKKDELNYFVNKDLKSIDADALKDIYIIKPNMSSDGLTREAKMQQSAQRMAMYAQNPFVDLSELTKESLMLDDPSLVDKVFKAPQVVDADQIEEQELELMILERQGQVMVKPSDVDEKHLDVIIAQLIRIMQKGGDVSQYWSIVANHTMDHLEKLRQTKNDEIYNAYRKKINDIMQSEAKMRKQLLEEIKQHGQRNIQAQVPQGVSQQLS